MADPQHWDAGLGELPDLKKLPTGVSGHIAVGRGNNPPPAPPRDSC